ncbi:MAG: glycosyltransferase [Gammaproteobacteria bacterium]|jgi:biofilm PGA synthesis N-glycosyltransferase PgaC
MIKRDEKKRKWRWLTVRQKFIIVFTLALCWVVVVSYINLTWIEQLAQYIYLPLAIIVISIIAIIPSFWFSFALLSFIIDTRPEYGTIDKYPEVSVLIAAYNEEKLIDQTIASLVKQKYPGKLEIILADDGSIDRTVEIAKSLNVKNLVILEEKHQGKAGMLNTALAAAKYDFIVTIDADTYLLEDSIKNIVEHMLSSLSDTAAVAGSVCVRNSRETFLTRIQEWNYFNEYISQKRIQSLLQATLVAQGSFSIFRKKCIQDVGGWPKCVGEDIVMTWALLEKDYRTAFSERSFAFTCAPVTYKKLFFQRSRWSQGMLESLARHWRLLFKRRMSTVFIWWNLLIPVIDLGYGFIFMPGVILAFFGYYFIAGPMTLSVVPLILLNNFIFYLRNKKEFAKRNLVVRRNTLGYLCFLFIYQPLIMVPSAIHGYFAFFIGWKKWGTK